MQNSSQTGLPSHAAINQALSGLGPFPWPKDEDELIKLLLRILNELPPCK